MLDALHTKNSQQVTKRIIRFKNTEQGNLVDLKTFLYLYSNE
jgi:hypothetical protein